MFRSVAGINPAAPGYAAIEIAPHVVLDAGPASTTATLDTVHGHIRVEWSRVADRPSRSFSLSVQVPRPASLVLPLLEYNSSVVRISEEIEGFTVWEAGSYVAGATGVIGASIGDRPSTVHIDVSSGTYDFLVVSQDDTIEVIPDSIVLYGSFMSLRHLAFGGDAGEAV